MMKLITRNWPRLLLYIFLGFLIMCSVIFWLGTDHSSLSENFFVGSIEIAITVVLIDGLLAMERKRRINALNAGHASASRFQLGLLIVRFMKEFNFPIEPNDLEVIGESNVVLRSKVNDFFESDEYGQYLQNVKDAKKGMLKKLKALEDIVIQSSNSVTESLEKSAPYPDPALVKLLSDIIPNLVASIKVIETMYKAVKIVRSSSLTGDAGLAKKIVDQEMDKLTSKVDIKSNSNRDVNLHEVLKLFMDAMLTVHERAESNKLHYDV